MKKLISFTLCFLSLKSYAGLPVVPASNQQDLLKSSSTQLAENKKIVYDFFRIVLAGRHLDQAAAFLDENYIQHNPNVETGLKGFLDYFAKLGGPKEIPKELKGLVSMQAEGDYVTLSFENQMTDSKSSGKPYTTTWFDMFRLQNRKIIEHWDCDTK